MKGFRITHGQPLRAENAFTSLTTTCAANVAGFFTRVESPTYAFDMADGAALAPHRDIVNNDLCTGCHQGTLYRLSLVSTSSLTC